MTDNHLLGEVLKISSNSKRDCALKQGSRFNNEQKQLNSTREGFSGNGKNPLEQTDKKEGKASGKLEQLFYAKMSDYSRKFDARIAGVLQRPSFPPVYGINTNEQLYSKNSQANTGNWNYLGGNSVYNMSATGRTHLWRVVSSGGDGEADWGVQRCIRPCTNNDWQVGADDADLPGVYIMQISADDEYVYGIASNDTVWRMREGWLAGESGGWSWEQIGGSFTNISASGKDWVWGVGADELTYRCAKPCTGDWIQDSANAGAAGVGAMAVVAGDKDYVWSVRTDGMIFRKPVNGSGDWDYSPSTRGADMTGPNVNRMLWVSTSSPNYVWGVGPDRRLYYCKKPCTDGNWQTMGQFGGGWRIEGDNNPGGGDITEADIENQEVQQTAALGASNDELISMAGQLWERTSNLNKVGGKARKTAQKKRNQLRQQMELLQSRREILNTLKGGNTTLDEKITSNRLELNSSYFQYMAWFGAAATLTAVAFHKIIAS